MRKVWGVELLLEVDDESCTEVIEFVENKLTAGEEYVACHVNRIIPVPPLGQQPSSQPMFKYNMKYGLKRLGIDMLEETDPHTLGKLTQFESLEKAINTVRMAPLASTIRHPRHRAKADKLCRELGKMWLDEILYHFEKQVKEDFMQKSKEVDDENKDS